LYNVVVHTDEGVVEGIYDVDFIYGFNASMLDFGNAWIGWAADAIVERLNDDISHDIIITGVGTTSSYEYFIPNMDKPMGGGYWTDRSTYNKDSSGVWARWGAEWMLGASVLPVSVFADFKEPASVPIPGAVWLLGTGLVGLVGVRKKFKK